MSPVRKFFNDLSYFSEKLAETKVSDEDCTTEDFLFIILNACMKDFFHYFRNRISSKFGKHQKLTMAVKRQT